MQERVVHELRSHVVQERVVRGLLTDSGQERVLHELFSHLVLESVVQELLNQILTGQTGSGAS